MNMNMINVTKYYNKNGKLNILHNIINRYMTNNKLITKWNHFASFM